jgi:hypothetical protein
MGVKKPSAVVQLLCVGLILFGCIFFLLIKITQNLPFRKKKRSEEAVSGVQLHEEGSVDRLAHRGHGFASVGNDAGARDAALIGSIEPTIIKNHKE